ncbi:Putative zn(2)-C6 fungal-type DNA-binding domain, tetratricopeptide-like helical domain superfamily [Septoria linicola]|uniref:Zn(2)-C6 fungal-type DNA-binding domain, tetratricopeptide-like helical domain superfamily n=1 Tax=Septoria linicola TaxID=215465 RepID=A0A9Q9EQQ5_9PEZI|nr:putative zn(2)-C6 fungal-type DNA-binding domain, tetratricopeptide-like helical domain superfamily [Septoria linicola]USW59039.1 Putative zn(2)-C6 fungal-type DNA-binding domain, tetratricopeptide-like helical domain superfamily [Septoria linicola]
MDDIAMTDNPITFGTHDLQELDNRTAESFAQGRRGSNSKRTQEIPACQTCKLRKVKCVPGAADPDRCKSCVRAGVTCVPAKWKERRHLGTYQPPPPPPPSQYPDPSNLGGPGPYGPGDGATPYGAIGVSGRQLGAAQLNPWHSISPDARVQQAAQDFHARNGDPGAMTAEDQRALLAERYAAIDGGAGRAATKRAAALASENMNERIYDAAGFRPEQHSWAVDIPGVDDGETEAELEEQIIFEDSDVPTRGGSSRGRGRGGKPKKGWRAVLRGTDHENVGKLPKNTVSKRGRPSDRAKNRGRKRKKEVDPGPEFKSYMAKANNSYMEGDLDTAIDLVRQAIGANPEIWSAHSLLSQILDSQGRHEDAIEALRFGIPTTREAKNWQHLADLITDKPEDELDFDTIMQAVFYVGHAISITKPESAQYDLRVKKFHLYNILQKRGQNNKNARLDAKNILRLFPYKTVFLKEFAVLCAGWSDKNEQELAIHRYDQAFTYYMDNFQNFGDEDDPTEDWEHLNIYLEMVELAGNPWIGLQQAKRIARWFVGRKNDTFWDRVSENDCEWDIEDERRHSVPEWQWGNVSRDPAQYGEGMPIEIKVRLGKLRLKMGVEHRGEAFRHFRELLHSADGVDEYRDTFEDVAQTLRKENFVLEALEWYGPLRNCDEADHPEHGLSDDIWYWMGVCYETIGKIDDSIACYEVVVRNRSDKHGHLLHAQAKLTKIYEERGELDKARFLCNDLIKISRHDLLIEQGVRMVPDEVKSRPVILPEPYRQMRKYINPPIKPRLEPNTYFRELRPAGLDDAGLAPIELRSGGSIAPTPYPILEGPVLGSSLINGPLSQSITLPPPIPEPFVPPKSTKRGRGKLIGMKKGKQNILEAITGAEGQDEGMNDKDEDALHPPKRPRLKKKVKAPSKAAIKAQNRAQLIHDIQQRVLANYLEVKVHWAGMKEGDEDATEGWVEGALGMLDDFTDMKIFFPDRDKYMRLKETDREQGKYQREGRLPDDAKTPEKFLSLSFPEWHHVFADLALVYARSAEQDKCYRILQDVLAGANVFYHNIRLKMTTYAVSLYCGLAFNDNQFIIDLARDLVKDSGDRGGEAFQIFAAVNRFAFGSNWFSAGPTQKWMLRMVKSHDFLAMPPDLRERFDWSQQKPSLEKKAEELSGELQDLDAGVLLLYGHMVAVANHSFSALPYYYRALALDPDNICVNLSIATMWIQNSMKRQTENRQFGIHQGLAFLYRYYDLRVASGKACHRQEAEFNVARMWHYLGLGHLALPSYEKVLDLSEEVQAEARTAEGKMYDGVAEDVEVAVENFAPEAAFALQGMYALAGNDEAGRSVTEKWLVM